MNLLLKPDKHEKYIYFQAINQIYSKVMEKKILCIAAVEPERFPYDEG